MYKRGPSESTGNYKTREELETAVGDLYERGVTTSNIVETVGVSIGTVHNILKQHREKKRLAKERENKALISRAWR